MYFLFISNPTMPFCQGEFKLARFINDKIFKKYLFFKDF